MNELDLIKLNIYEAFENGEISYGEKCLLLEQVDMSNTRMTVYGAVPVYTKNKTIPYVDTDIKGAVIIQLSNIFDKNNVKNMYDLNKLKVYVPGIADERHPNGLGLVARQVLLDPQNKITVHIWNDYPIIKLKKKGSTFSTPKEKPDSTRVISVTELMKMVEILDEKEFNSPALKKRLKY